jgi:hypothetical protein
MCVYVCMGREQSGPFIFQWIQFSVDLFLDYAYRHVRVSKRYPYPDTQQSFVRLRSCRKQCILSRLPMPPQGKALDRTPAHLLKWMPWECWGA